MKKVFVETHNVTRFHSIVKASQQVKTEPLFLLFYGPPGRGKTTAARKYAADEGWIYARVLKSWQSQLKMLQDLAFEAGIVEPPRRMAASFDALLAELRARPRPVLIDEADKLSENALEWVRDLADLSLCPVVLLGETRTLTTFKKPAMRRFWSRTLKAVEFEPITTKDVLFFAKQAFDLSITAAQAEMLRTQPDGVGDFRPVLTALISLEEDMRVNNVAAVTDDLVRRAIQRNEKERKP